MADPRLRSSGPFSRPATAARSANRPKFRSSPSSVRSSLTSRDRRLDQLFRRHRGRRRVDPEFAFNPSICRDEAQP
ncbi:hypothetical protein CGRA01v4_11875 [Colletotrichum graminicola]|nr:hypothetical protein CGRA01v4_11875 [Colletotrichum graminicola]